MARQAHEDYLAAAEEARQMGRRLDERSRLAAALKAVPVSRENPFFAYRRAARPGPALPRWMNRWVLRGLLVAFCLVCLVYLLLGPKN